MTEDKVCWDPEYGCMMYRLQGAVDPQELSHTDIEEAEMHRLGAEAGDPESMREYAKCLFEGRGVSQDTAEAARWFAMGAEAGNRQCSWELASCLLFGDGV